MFHVSNTTPLISLAGVGLLDLLQQIYGKIWIPDIVRNEYLAGARANDPLLDNLSWVIIIPVVGYAPSLPSELNPGEAAAITLALSKHAQTILLDDKQARQAAQQHGLSVVGSVGILLRAKQLGLIGPVKPIIDAMIAQGRHISPHLRAHVLHLAGEQP
jgi:hypothetical protein